MTGNTTGHFLVGCRGLEPPTPSLDAKLSNSSWWAWEDSNLRPRHYQ